MTVLEKITPYLQIPPGMDLREALRRLRDIAASQENAELKLNDMADGYPPQFFAAAVLVVERLLAGRKT
jgi:hypothetical protein